MATDASWMSCRPRRSVYLLIEVTLVLTLALTLVSSARGQILYEQFGDYDLAMFDSPRLFFETPVEVVYGEGLTELWERALERPDAELQRLVIDTLAVAHRRGIEGTEAFVPRLVEMASLPQQSLEVLRAIVQTLIVLDAREQASLLAELAQQHGAPISQLVEPALAKWRDQAMENVWLERIRGSTSGTTMTVLAIDGLAGIESDEARQPLQGIVRNLGAPRQVRMAAATALGRLHDSGLVNLAREIIEEPSQPISLHSILAVRLLARHGDMPSVELLENLVSHESTTVQSEALEQLYRIDFRLLDQHREQLAASRDVNVRRWCLRSLVESRRSDRIEWICRFLDDVNPDLRRQASQSLIQLAIREEAPVSESPDEATGPTAADSKGGGSLRDVILEETSKVLAQDAWRGCEQACVVLTRLDHKPSGRRLVELLGHERGEVQVAAAWGLSKLRIAELLPDMLDHAESIYEGFRSGALSDAMPGMSLHVAHLFIAFGDQGHAPAEPLMRRYLPKDHSLGLESRAAAAWAFGLLYPENPQPDLVSLFVGRLYDNGINPDSEEMRSMSAVSLGRMKAESALSDLRTFASQGMRAAEWAVEQMTGEKPKPTKSEPVPVDDWFLSPIRSLEP